MPGGLITVLHFIRDLLLNVLLILVLIVFIPLLPIILPLVSFLQNREDRRKRALAEKFRCLNCNQILGGTALELADKEWFEYVEQLHRDNPGMRFRLNRILDAVCPTCGERYTYREKENSFTRETANFRS